MSINAEYEYRPDDYVYVDVETGGLDPDKHPLLEVAYAVGHGPVKTLYPNLNYAFESSDPKALEVNQFLKRFAAQDENGTWYGVPWEFNVADLPDPQYNMQAPTAPLGLAFLNLPPASMDHQWDEFINETRGKVPVGANVQFDVAFIKKYFHPEPVEWSHRILSLNAWGAGILRSGTTVSFQTLVDEINEHLAENGITSRVPEIDHTAAGDVETTRAVHQYLVWQYVTNRAVEDSAIPKFLWDEVRED